MGRRSGRLGAQPACMPVSAAARLCALLWCCLSASPASAADYVVGGDTGWAIPQNLDYQAYANANLASLVAGDALVFRYSSEHTVWLARGPQQVSACEFAGAAELGNNTQGGGNGLRYTLASNGTTYGFMCNVNIPEHCLLGMRFTVTTLATGSVVPSVSPPPPASSSPSPTSSTPTPTPASPSPNAGTAQHCLTLHSGWWPAVTLLAGMMLGYAA